LLLKNLAPHYPFDISQYIQEVKGAFTPPHRPHFWPPSRYRPPFVARDGRKPPSLKDILMTTNHILPEQFSPQFHISNPTQHQTHELKIWPGCFAAVKAGNKPFDVRENDRNFQVGDELRLCEYEPETEQYTGKTVTRWVSYVLQGGVFGIQPNWCVLGFSDQAPIPTGITDIRLW
jgi:hypothetical protein